MQDVTDRGRAEEALRQSEERFRLAFTHAAVGKWIVALDRRILQVNPAACRMLGYREAQLLMRTTHSIGHPEDVASTDEFVRRLFEPQLASGTLETRLIHQDGRTIWVVLTATFVRDAQGKPLYFVSETQDVTERRRAEQALRESEQRFRNLCTQAPVMLMAFDPQGRVRDVSNYWLQTMGYTQQEVVGREGWDFITPESQDRLRQSCEECQRSNHSMIPRSTTQSKSLPLRAIRKDGTMVDVLSTSVAHAGDDGENKGAICVMINLTELQRAEDALRESEERYRALVEHAPEAILVYDADQDRYVDANAPAQELLGYTRERLLTMSPLDFCPEARSGDYDPCAKTQCEIDTVLQGGTTVFETGQIDATGREIPCQIRLSRLPAAGRSLVRVTITDISELKQLQARIQHAEQMGAVGVLAAGVAHEIGNPLHALSMAAHSLERRASDDYSKRKLALIREHIDRISRIVRQMGEQARLPSRRSAPVDPNRVVRRALEVIRHDKRAEGAEICFELSETLPLVQAVEDELTQVCINLALNAFDAMASLPAQQPRRLTIRSEATSSAVKVSFHDTGPGVPRELRARLFQPFFTTKGVGKGTGLGLSVSYRILQEHQGTLRFDELATLGAAFVFELPLAAQS